MSVQTKRRTFLGATAAAAAMAAAAVARAGPGHDGPDEDDAPEGLEGVAWDKAPCRFCGTGCHVEVGVRDGQVVAIRGDQKAEVNRGLLCVKGYHVGLALYGRDRLTRPLLRKDGELVPISWTEAIDVIAKRVLRGPEGFAIYGSGQWTIPEGYAAQKFMKGGLSCNHIDPNARLCMASAVTGFIATYGVDEPAGCYDDLDRCDVLICWGNNPAEMHPVLFSRVLDRRARGEQVRIIDIGTRRTRTTEFADEFVALEPHGDLALVNAITKLLLDRGTWAEDFVAAHCAFRADSDPPTLAGEAIDFDTYAAGLADYGVERCAELSGVPAAKIRALADLFGDRELRITSLWCMGVNQHTQGTALNTLIHGLHLLSGHIARPGDAPTSLTGQPSACGTAREVGTLAHALPGGRLVAKAEHRAQCEQLWNLRPGTIAAKPGYHTIEMWRRFSTPADAGGDIHTIWVQVTNPAQSLPNRAALVDPSRELDGDEKFLIVSDVYPTATTQIADLVLPSAMWVEKNGIFGNSERRTQQWFKMVEPPGDARDDCWQIIAVARRLDELGLAGMRDADGRFLFEVGDTPVWDWARYYDVNVDEHLFEEYRAFTRLKHKDLAPYAEYVASRGLRWPVVQTADGGWRETRFRFVEGEDPYVEAGKGVDFYHSPSGDGRAQIWFRPHVPPPEQPDDEYPLWLSTGRVLEHWHTGTMTERMAPLRAAMPGAYVEIHPRDAAALGISDGREVVVETRRGSLTLPAWIDGRGAPEPGSLFIPFFDETRLANLLTLETFDPFSKQPDYKKCAARIRLLPAGKGAGAGI